MSFVKHNWVNGEVLTADLMNRIEDELEEIRLKLRDANLRGDERLIKDLKFQEKRKMLGIDLDAFVFLSVGELSTRKNQKQIIEALKLLKDKNEIHNICYIAVGNGDKKSDFEGNI